MKHILPPAAERPPEKDSGPATLASFGILLYGALVTYGVVIMIGVSNAFNVGGDGPRGPSHTPLLNAWPVAAWYLFSAIAPHLPRDRRSRILCITLPLLVGICVCVFGGEDGLMIAGITAATSILVWLPLLLKKD
jgi:hypothetical protein